MYKHNKIVNETWRGIIFLLLYVYLDFKFWVVHCLPIVAEKKRQLVFLVFGALLVSGTDILTGKRDAAWFLLIVFLCD